MATRKTIANVLKAATARRMVRKRHATTFELGVCRWGKLRADVVSLSMRGEITIFEIKSCVSDFMTDSKCEQYLKYCHKMYFVFEDKTWNKLKEKVSFPPQVGVITRDQMGSLTVVKRSKRHEMDPKVHQNLLLRLAYRASEFRNLRAVNEWAKSNI